MKTSESGPASGRGSIQATRLWPRGFFFWLAVVPLLVGGGVAVQASAADSINVNDLQAKTRNLIIPDDEGSVLIPKAATSGSSVTTDVSEMPSAASVTWSPQDDIVSPVISDEHTAALKNYSQGTGGTAAHSLAAGVKFFGITADLVSVKAKASRGPGTATGNVTATLKIGGKETTLTSLLDKTDVDLDLGKAAKFPSYTSEIGEFDIKLRDLTSIPSWILGLFGLADATVTSKAFVKASVPALFVHADPGSNGGAQLIVDLGLVATLLGELGVHDFSLWRVSGSVDFTINQQLLGATLSSTSKALVELPRPGVRKGLATRFTDEWAVSSLAATIHAKGEIKFDAGSWGIWKFKIDRDIKKLKGFPLADKTYLDAGGKILIP